MTIRIILVATITTTIKAVIIRIGMITHNKYYRCLNLLREGVKWSELGVGEEFLHGALSKLGHTGYKVI